MSEHKATITWRRSGEAADFLRGRYSREHTWKFDGGLTVPASPSPSVVPAPWSNAAHVDPEEALVASASSCHMLTFVWLAGKAGFQVDSYEDDSIGVMSKNEMGVPWISLITLRPKIVYGGERRPLPEDVNNLHHQAHKQCFIANSIRAEIRVEE